MNKYFLEQLRATEPDAPPVAGPSKQQEGPPKGKSKKAPKIRHEVLNEIWTQLEKDGFKYGDLLVLETVQVLEGYVSMEQRLLQPTLTLD